MLLLVQEHASSDAVLAHVFVRNSLEKLRRRLGGLRPFEQHIIGRWRAEACL